jgi:monofunctional biosynthetic peptidoglycan transglycosylase
MIKVKNKSVSNSSDSRGSYGKWLLKGVFYLFISITISVLTLVIAYRWVNPPLTWLMVDRFVSGESTQFKTIKHQWVGIDSISPNIIQAVVAAEDNLFLFHKGFDFDAITKAREDRNKGKRIRGASTISMQVSKNVFLWHGRTWTRKAFEAGFTILIENLWSKQRIMEVYLNVAEFGPSVYGIEAASQQYYKKKSLKLNRNEAAMLATVLPLPLKRNPNSPTPYMQNYQQRVLRNMRNIGEVTFPEKSKPVEKKTKSKSS